MDLFNYNGTEATNPLESMSSDEILKAMEAGLLTGMQYNDQLNNGGGLKPESLDSVLKNLENRLDQLVFWNELNRQKIDNTVHQYNQLYKYGQEVGIFNQDPGHVDFSYEVSRSIAACEGALLVVDASQGVQAQTISNLYMALEHDLEIIPVMNKCDMASAMPEEVEDEIIDLLGCKREDIIRASGKTGPSLLSAAD